MPMATTSTGVSSGTPSRTPERRDGHRIASAAAIFHAVARGLTRPLERLARGHRDTGTEEHGGNSDHRRHENTKSTKLSRRGLTSVRVRDHSAARGAFCSRFAFVLVPRGLRGSYVSRSLTMHPETPMKRAAPFASLLSLVVVLVFSIARAEQEQPAPDPAARFEVSDVMIPMRDGHAAAYQDLRAARARAGRCRSSSSARRTASRDRRATSTPTYKALADEGYIFVFQDIRGKFESEGDFVMQRPPRASRATRSRSTKAPTPTTPSTG